jgi:phosphoribosylformylglycinamidine synthase
MARGLVRSCHDVCEGGLAVALAEMAIAGGLGVDAALEPVPRDEDANSDFVLLFSESPTRFLLEVRPEHCNAVEDQLGTWCLSRIGEVGPGPGGSGQATPRVIIRGLDGSTVVDALVDDLRKSWQGPLRWN